MRFTGQNIAAFSAQNFLGLDHWQVMHMEDDRGGLVLATHKDAKARVYLGFFSKEPIEYDFRDTDAQERLIAEHFEGAEWVFPLSLAEMGASPDFYFYQTNQVYIPRGHGWRCRLQRLTGVLGRHDGGNGRRIRAGG